MNSREKKNIQKVEEVFKAVHLQGGDDAVQPSVRWQRSVMRQVRHSATPEATSVRERFSLFWPVAQLATAAAIALGVALLTDQSLTNLDMAIYESEVASQSHSLASYYSF